MAVPAQVQARADKADELLKQAQASTEKPAGEVSAAPTGDRDKDKPAQAETVDSLKALLAEAQQKLATLQGKYNNEIQALKDDVNLLNSLKNQVRTLTDRTSDLSGKLTEANRVNGELQKQLADRPAAPAADDGKSTLANLSAEDLDYLRGEGFDDKAIGIIVKAVSGNRAAQPAQDNKTEIDELRNELEQNKVKAFWKEFAEKVPDWQAINTSDEFNDWLDLALPYSTETRRDRLQTAQKASDAMTAIQIFTDFKSANPGYANKNKQEHRIDPNKQIEPDSSVVHQPPTDGKPAPAGKTYTRQEVREFYKALSLASAAGNVTEDMQKTDADIVLANAEGRIQG